MAYGAAAADTSTGELIGATRRWVESLVGTAIQDKGTLAPPADIDAIKESGRYSVLSGTTATSLNLPFASAGSFLVTKWGSASAIQRYSSFGRVAQRTSLSTGWSPWVELGNGQSRHKFLDSTSNINAMYEADSYSIRSAQAAKDLGIPTTNAGVFTVIPWGSTSAIQTYITGSKLLQRISNSDGWSAWTEIGASPTAPTTAPTSTSSGRIRTLPIALTVGASSADGALKGTARYAFHIAPKVRRWRLHIVNKNPLYPTERTHATTFGGLWVGDSTDNGGMSNPVSAGAVPGIPAGSFEAVTAWNSTVQIGGRPLVFSLSYDSAGAPIALPGGGWLSSDYAAAGGASSTGFALQTRMPFHIWVEAEVDSHIPAVGIFGSSSSGGVGSRLPVHDSPLSQWARSNGALPVHWSFSGSTMEQGLSASPEHYRWTIWNDLDRPDAVLFYMGSNDVFADATLEQMKARTEASIPLVEKNYAPVIYGVTIPPRTNETGATEDTRRAYNQWVKTRFRDTFDFASTVSNDDETLIPAYDSDGLHLTTAGYAENAKAITRPVGGPLMATKADIPAAPVTQDTGWRKLTTASGITGDVFMRRKGLDVHMMLYNVGVSAAGHTTICAVPVGFQPQTITGANWRNGSVQSDNGSSVRPTSFFTGNMRILNAATSVTYGGYITWITNDPWPTELPGTAV